jgi:hypothetical protein
MQVAINNLKASDLIFIRLGSLFLEDFSSVVLPFLHAFVLNIFGTESRFLTDGITS